MTINPLKQVVIVVTFDDGYQCTFGPFIPCPNMAESVNEALADLAMREDVRAAVATQELDKEPTP